MLTPRIPLLKLSSTVDRACVARPRRRRGCKQHFRLRPRWWCGIPSGRPFGGGALALPLQADRLDDAESVATTTAANLDDDSPLGLSVRGALTLIAAVIAGRRNDRAEATERLQRAQLLADQLGEDGNYGWTAFGPTNVAIHRVSAAAELGDASSAIAQAEFVDVDSMPSGLLSRRAQVHIDMAWAYSQRRADAEAVVNLMEAERVAPQALRYNIVVRELLREMLKRERRTATPGLRALARRANVLEN